MQFSYDNITWSTPEAYASTKAWTLTSGDGTKTVYARFKNNADIWSSVYSDTITLDTIVPSTTALPVGGSYSSAQTVTLSCDDGSGSDCSGTQYCLGGGCTPSIPYSGSISISSSNTLRFYSTDNAGNSESVKTEVYTISGSSQYVPPGMNPEVPVSVNCGSETQTVTVKFDQVTSGGNLNITCSSNPPPGSPPRESGFKFIGYYFDIDFEGDHLGDIYVTVPFDCSLPQAGNLMIKHGTDHGWIDCTDSIDTQAPECSITGRVTDLSPFGIGFPWGPWVGYSTGTNEYMIAFIAICTISAGLLILRRSRRIKV
jgi:hypothetical protein